jgi:hypothetical protein
MNLLVIYILNFFIFFYNHLFEFGAVFLYQRQMAWDYFAYSMEKIEHCRSFYFEKWPRYHTSILPA